eukprot:882851-Alexandrium_andersonii.AAC.1
MLVSGAIRLNPQSSMRKMQDHFKRSELGLRGPKTRLEHWPPKLPRGALCAIFRADSEPGKQVNG